MPGPELTYYNQKSGLYDLGMIEQPNKYFCFGLSTSKIATKQKLVSH